MGINKYFTSHVDEILNADCAKHVLLTFHVGGE